MRTFPAALAAVLLLPLPFAVAQNLPHIGYVYPAGGKQGSTLQITVGGQFLGGTTNILVSGGGVTAKVGDYSRPMTQREFNDLREQMDQLRKKREAIQANRRGKAKGSAQGWTAADERLFAEVRKKLANSQRRPPNPAIAETVTITVSISSDAAPGSRELRLRTANGLSNPMMFKIGQLPEVAEKPEKTMEERPAFARRPASAPPVNPPEISVTLPVVVNGQIMAGDVDRIKFRAGKGQKLVLAASARELVPYLPDAVPGWFQATLTLFDSKGREIAYDDDFRFNPDPVLFLDVPKDGEYVVEIKDSIFRGREDFVYRLQIGELPFVTGIFPMGSSAGEEAAVKVSGWNLQEPTIKVAPAADGAMLQFVQTRREDAFSNLIPFERSDLPEIVETDDSAGAQSLNLPIVVNGRIESADDVDTFRFQGKAGMDFVAEVSARRLNSPLDSILKLIGPDGKEVACNDDFEDKAAGLTTHHADSKLSLKLPADGPYVVELADAQRKGGPDYAYRLRLSQPHPDFELRIVPSTITVRAGGTVPLTVHALRKDGFDGEILLSVDGEDNGVTLGGARVPRNTDQVRFTLTAPLSSAGEVVPLKIDGRAIVGGKVVTRPALPSEDMMQAFFYRHLVPAREMLLCVSGAFPQRWPIRIASDVPVQIPCGGTASVRFTVPKFAADRASLSLSEAPEGITIKKLGSWASGAEVVLACEAGKTKPGTRGNLIFEPSFARAQNNKKAAGVRNPMGALPAVPFEVIAP